MRGTLVEKNIEFRNNDKIQILGLFDSNSYGLFSMINRGSLKSIISNLINNSIESLQANSGVIELNLKSDGIFNVITLGL